MGKGSSFMDRFAERTELLAEPMPGQPVVEIAGEGRVLVENHLGVMAYGHEKIVIRVKYGAVCVCGCGLEILRMTREQLIIRGRVQGITLQRRGND